MPKLIQNSQQKNFRTTYRVSLYQRNLQTCNFENLIYFSLCLSENLLQSNPTRKEFSCDFVPKCLEMCKCVQCCRSLFLKLLLLTVNSFEFSKEQGQNPGKISPYTNHVGSFGKASNLSSKYVILDGCVKRNAELLQISQPSKSKQNNSGSDFNIGLSILSTLLHSREHTLNTFLRKSRRKTVNYLEMFAPIYKVFWVLIDGVLIRPSPTKKITLSKPGFRGEQYV